MNLTLISTFILCLSIINLSYINISAVRLNECAEYFLTDVDVSKIQYRAEFLTHDIILHIRYYIAARR